MPGSFLNDTERERLRGFPAEIPSEDLIGYFTLSERDQLLVRGQRGDSQPPRLRVAGLCPSLSGLRADQAPFRTPGRHRPSRRTARCRSRCLAKYGERSQTRTSHLQEVLAYLGLSQGPARDLRALKTWLVDRGLEHDRPSLLFQLACEKLRTDKVVRPGLTCLERMVVAAQQEAQHETFRILSPLLSDDTKTLLDGLLVPDAVRGGTALAWLRRAAVSNSPKAILRNIEKLEFLKGAGVERWALDGLSPNRLKRLAQIARRATGQALQRMPEERRYPLLVAFLHQSLVDVADETIDQFDRCLAEAYARAGHDLEEFRGSVAAGHQRDGPALRRAGPRRARPHGPRRPAPTRHLPDESRPNGSGKPSRNPAGSSAPSDDSGLDFLRKRYGHLRRFVPAFLAAFSFRSNVDPDPLLKAVDLLRRLGERRGPSLPRSTAVDFVPAKWRPYVIDGQGRIDRAYFELCVLSELARRCGPATSGSESSRRYSDPETYLIPKDRWTALRGEVCQQLQVPDEGTVASHATRGRAGGAPGTSRPLAGA